MIARQSVQTAIKPSDEEYKKVFIRRHIVEYPEFNDEKRAI